MAQKWYYNRVFIFVVFIAVATFIVYNIRNEKTDEFLLISSFNGLNGQELDLYTSYDGIQFNPLNVSSVSSAYRKFKTKYLRDPSIMYHNGYFYICFTTNIESGSIKGFGVARSKDLIKWEEFTVPVPSKYTTCWAPEWFIDGSDVYIIVSLSDKTKERDIEGKNILYFKQYYMKATNSNLTTYTNPIESDFSKGSNKIDGQVILEDGVYHFFVKNEFNKTIEHYTSSTFEKGTWQYQQTINYPVYVEGPCCVKYKGEYYLYADGFNTKDSWCVKSLDLKTWSTAFQVGSPEGIRTQHFTAIVANKEISKKIQKLINQN